MLNDSRPIAGLKTKNMKKHISRILGIILLVTAVGAGSFTRAVAQDVQVSFQVFYDNLSPYGQWVYDPDYGNVWVPNEGGDFRPYGSRGHWVMTDYGNTWVSDDPWGWAVYHYGRWTYNPYYGWIWVPGYEWAPAWVSWRYGGGYAGWAPLAPGISVGMSFYAPDSWWIFMGPQYMYQPNCIRYWYGPSYNTNYIHQTTIINNYYVDNSTRVRYNYGPRAEVIQQVTGHPVKVYQVSHRNRPGAPTVGRNTVSLYRPNVNTATVREAHPARVVQAPRSIGRGTQPVQQMGDRQPAFRQELPRLQQQEGGRGHNVEPGGRTQPERRPEPGRMNEDRGGRVQQQDDRPRQAPEPRNENRPQPGRFDNRPQQAPEPRNENRPQPGRFDNRPQQGPEPRNENRPQPGRFDNRPQQAPEPRNENRPQPGRFENRPQQAPEPRQEPRHFENRPVPQQRQPEPRMENRPQGRPQGQPQQEARPHGGGRR